MYEIQRHLFNGLRLVWRLAEECLVQDDPHRPDVHLGVVLAPEQHLGGHVERGALDLGRSVLVGKVLREAKVRQLQHGLPGRGEEDVGRLQVHVGDALGSQVPSVRFHSRLESYFSFKNRMRAVPSS